MYTKPRIFEVREVGSFNSLYTYMAADSNLKSLLYTKYCDLPKMYQHLFAHEDGKLVSTTTLFNQISGYLANSAESTSKAFFIIMNKQFVGFMGYKTAKDRTTSKTGNHGSFVKSITLFTCDLRYGITLAHDAFDLIQDLRRQYTFIHWSAIKGNPAIKAYNRLINRYGGNSRPSKNTPNTLYFEIPGTGIIPSEPLLLNPCGIDHSV